MINGESSHKNMMPPNGVDEHKRKRKATKDVDEYVDVHYVDASVISLAMDLEV